MLCKVLNRERNSHTLPRTRHGTLGILNFMVFAMAAYAGEALSLCASAQEVPKATLTLPKVEKLPNFHPKNDVELAELILHYIKEVGQRRLDWRYEVDDQLVEFLKEFRQVKELTCKRTVGRVELARLAKVDTLSRLNIYDLADAEMLSGLQPNRGLKSVFAVCSKASELKLDEGFDGLEELTVVFALVDGSRDGQLSALTLVDLPSIKSATFENLGVNEVVLQNLPKLEEMVLPHSRILPGSRMNAQPYTFRNVPKLKFISMSCPLVAEIRALSQCPQLEVTEIHMGVDLKRSDYDFVSEFGPQFARLNSFYLYGCDHFTLDRFDSLIKVPNLAHLQLKELPYSREAVLKLAKFSKLERLSVQFIKNDGSVPVLGKNEIEALGDLPRLKHLYLDRAVVTKDSAEAFSNLRQLETLSIEVAQDNSQVEAVLKRVLPQTTVWVHQSR